MIPRGVLAVCAAVFSSCIFAPSDICAVSASEGPDFAYIEKAFNGGLYDISREKLESFIRDYPQAPRLYQAHSLLGRSYFRLNDLPAAAYEFQSILASPAASEFQDEALYWSGEICLKNGDLNGAIGYYEKVISDFPASRYLGFATYSKGWAYYKLGMYDDAVRCFKGVVLGYPMGKVSMDAQFRIGECYYLSADYSASEKEFEKFIESYPVSEKTPEAYYMSGEAKYHLGKRNESVALMERALSISPQAGWAPLALYRMGMALSETGEIDAGGRKLYECLAATGSALIRSRALIGLARNYERSFDLPGSLKMCDEVIATYPDSGMLPEAYCRKASLLYKEEKYDDAEDLCLKAIGDIGHSPYAGRLHYELGRVYAARGDRDAAVKEFGAAIRESGDRDIKAGSLAGIGDVFFRQKDYRRAAESYDSVLNRYPGSFCADYAQLRIADISSLNARYDQAILAYQSILVNFPDTSLRSGAVFGLGTAYLNQGDLARSSSEFERYLKEFPEGELVDLAGLYLANSLYGMGRYEAAAVLFRDIEKGASEKMIRAMASYQIGWCLHSMKKAPEAAAAFEAFLKSYRSSEMAPDALFRLGEYYRSIGKRDRARAYFESISADFPSSGIAEEALMQTAVILSEEGKPDQAVPKLEALAVKFPDSAGAAYRRIARIKKDAREPDQAVKYLEMALTDSDSEANAQTQYEIAEIYEDRGDLDRACEEYLKVPRDYPSGLFWSVRAELKSAQILERLGRQADAAALYEKLAGMDVDESAFARKRLEELK